MKPVGVIGSLCTDPLLCLEKSTICQTSCKHSFFQAHVEVCCLVARSFHVLIMGRVTVRYRVEKLELDGTIFLKIV